MHFSSPYNANVCFTLLLLHTSFSSSDTDALFQSNPSKEQPNVPDEQAIEFHFEDQCREGDTNAFKVDSVGRLADAEVPLLHTQGISQVPSCWLLAGQITASKGMENALNKVQVLMCLVRIPDKATDVLLTLNTPIFIAAESAAAKTAGSGHQSAYVDAPRLFSKIIASFCILNWDLFD